MGFGPFCSFCLNFHFFIFATKSFGSHTLPSARWTIFPCSSIRSVVSVWVSRSPLNSAITPNCVSRSLIAFSGPVRNEKFAVSMPRAVAYYFSTPGVS